MHSTKVMYNSTFNLATTPAVRGDLILQLQFFQQSDLVTVSKFLCDCLDVMLVLLLTIRVRFLISPKWLEEV